jgi:hypothetical protein
MIELTFLRGPKGRATSYLERGPFAIVNHSRTLALALTAKAEVPWSKEWVNLADEKDYFAH